MQENENIRKLTWQEMLESLDPRIFEEKILGMPYFPLDMIEEENNMARRQKRIEANYWWARSRGLIEREKTPSQSRF